MPASLASILRPAAAGPQSRHHTGRSAHNSGRRGRHNHADPASSGSRGNSTTTYPEALPSEYEEKFTGPVVGTAVLDEDVMPLDEAAAVFEMVTPENSPLLKTHVKERFEAAVEERLELRRAQHVDDEPHHDHNGSVTGSGADNTPTEDSGSASGSAGTAPIPASGNVFDCFPTPDPDFQTFHKSKTHHRRSVLEGGYFIFSNRFLRANPSACVTGVTNELHMAAPESDILPHDRAPKSRLLEVKAYIKEVEHEYRPLFRRRGSDLVYGRATYVPPDGTAMVSALDKCGSAPQLDALPAQQDAHSSSKARKGLRKVFSSPFL